jgi:bifunctional DNA-binding transcriptional regulator/antitoxin component of YhaV-PrlF toxin-antitoxin module
MLLLCQEASMAYRSTVQVIERANDTRQYYLICPAPLARALEIEKGESIDWVVEDKYTLVLKRTAGGGASRRLRRSRHGQ